MTTKQTRHIVKFHYRTKAGTALCSSFAHHALDRAGFFAAEPAHRCAKCEAKAVKYGWAPKKIVPDSVESGSTEHLDALSRFFGI
jgi:hypothetical protein